MHCYVKPWMWIFCDLFYCSVFAIVRICKIFPVRIKSLLLIIGIQIALLGRWSSWWQCREANIFVIFLCYAYLSNVVKGIVILYKGLVGVFYNWHPLQGRKRKKINARIRQISSHLLDSGSMEYSKCYLWCFNLWILFFDIMRCWL